MSQWSMNRRRFLASSAALGAASTPMMGSAFAQSSRPIRAIVPFTVGSGSDITARTVMDKVSSKIGQTIIIENKTGAGGTIGAGYVAKAEPDGETLLIDSSAHTTVPFFYPKLDYDPVKGFETVASIATIPLVLITASSKDYKSAKDIVTYAQANPGAVTYASGGTGSATHLPAERFRLQAKFTGVHVPFRGGPDAMREVLTGRIDFYFIPVLPALSLIKNGQLRALAVSTNTRCLALPDVPTLAEAGYPNADYNFWIGAFAPAKTPSAICDRFHAEINAAVQSPDLAAKLASYGAEPMLMSRAEFDKFLARELEVNGPLIKATGMTVEQ